MPLISLRKFLLLTFAMMIGSLGVISGVADAAPFCVVVRSMAPQCIYYDTKECSKRAAQLDGFCDVNPEEVVIPPGIGKYCLIDSNKVIQCIYPDRLSCASASKDGAICVDGSLDDTQADPFREDPNRNY